jgi:hypothetical protein
MRVLVAAILVLLAAAPTAVAAPRCRVPGTRVLKQNHFARLLIRREPPRSLYTCARGHAHAKRLARNAGPRRVRLAGRWALYTAPYRDTGGSTLTRADVVTGRRRDIDFLYAKYSLHTSGAWVLNRRGTVAWITATDGVRGADFRDDTLVVDVRIVDRAGHRRVVDRAEYRPFRNELPPIPDDSLRLTDGGRTLHWTHDGQPRSAPLRNH